MLKRLTKYLLIGFISVIPAVLTFQLFMFFYEKIISLILNFYGVTNSWWAIIGGIFLSIIFFIIIGRSVIVYGSSTYLKFLDAIANKVPVLSSVYSILKKVTNMFFSEEHSFSEVVFIEYPRREIWVPAYVTNKVKNGYVLFIPTSPNPTYGFTVLVNEKEIIKSNISMEEATSFIVSIGVDLEKEEIIKELENIIKSK